MNEKELIGKVNSSMSRQCRERGYAAPVDVLMDTGYLSKKEIMEQPGQEEDSSGGASIS